MSDQPNNVSGGMSLLLKTAKPERAVPKVGKDGTNGNATAFSKDLDQARQQQHGNTRAEPLHPEKSTASRLLFAAGSKNTTPSATMVQMSQLDLSRNAQGSLVDESAVVGAAGRLIATDTVDLTNVLQTRTIQRLNEETKPHSAIAIDSQSNLPVTATISENNSGIQTSNTEASQWLQQPGAAATSLVGVTASDRTAPAPMSGVRIGAVGEIVTPGTVVGQSRQSPLGLREGGLSQDSLIEEQSAAGVAGRLMPTEIDEPADARLSETIQRANDEAQQNAVVSIDSQRKLPASVALSENGSVQRTSDTEAMQPYETQSAASTPVVSDAASNMTSPATISGFRNGAVGEIVTQGTLAGRSGKLVNSLQKNTGMAIAPGLSSGNLSGSGALANATTPESQASDQAVKSTLVQVNTTGLTQVTSGSAMVTQATLVGRLRQQINDDAAKNGAEVLQMTGSARPLQARTSALNAHVLERLPATESPLLNSSLPGGESLMDVIGGNKGVQQRIATTEAMLSQMAVDAGNTVVRAPAADNMLLAMTGGAAAAPAVQHTDSTAGPVIQAPLNIPLTTTEAETALAGNVKWMTNEGVKNAVMTVTPHGMGPISIKIGIEGNQMDVSIIASQHTTRDALESMLPRLREQLAVQGHESVKVDVSDGKSDQSRSGNGHAFADSRNPAGTTPQDRQSNSSNKGETTEHGGSEQLEVVSESFMAEDLQRVAARVVGEVDGRPVFDAYV